MKLKTYEDWKLLGYQVQKGEKSQARCPKTGKPLFSRQQVEEIEERTGMGREED